VGTTGPMGSGLPQFGFPRRFAIGIYILKRNDFSGTADSGLGKCAPSASNINSHFRDFFFKNQ
jgi:hypothetical protein